MNPNTSTTMQLREEYAYLSDPKCLEGLDTRSEEKFLRVRKIENETSEFAPRSNSSSFQLLKSLRSRKGTVKIFSISVLDFNGTSDRSFLMKLMTGVTDS
jgi:hypothetical protein